MRNTKILAGIALLTSWAFIVAIILGGLLFYQDVNKPGEIKKINLNNNGNNSNNFTGITEELTLTNDEVAKHSILTDCWMIIDSKIYDFTSFLKEHPGGTGAMTPYCGKDGSQAYATKDKSPGKAHSQVAQSLLSSFYIGDLNQVISQQVVQNRVNESAANAKNISVNGDDDYEEYEND